MAMSAREREHDEHEPRATSQRNDGRTKLKIRTSSPLRRILAAGLLGSYWAIQQQRAYRNTAGPGHGGDVAINVTSPAPASADVEENDAPNTTNNGVRVYAPSRSPSNVAACLVVYNETPYLDEWLDFHIALGFSPVYIYDNSPDFQLRTEPFGGNESWHASRRDMHDHVRLIHFPEVPVQKAAYERCIKRDAANSTYAALIDVDEFLVLKRHDNVIDFMDSLCDFRCGQVSVNWRVMGISGGRRYAPVPVLRRNVHYSLGNAMHGTIKVIVRPGNVAEHMQWRHSVLLKKGKKWIDTNGKKQPDYSPGDYRRQQNYDRPLDAAVLYHYPFRSEEEFRYKTCGKGTSLHARDARPFCGNPKYYAIYNGTTFDDAAWRQLTRMVPKYRVFGEAENTTHQRHW